MKFRLLTGLSALVCLSLASCHPYDESQGKKKAGKSSEKVKTPEEIAKEKEAEAKKKADEDLKKKEADPNKLDPNVTPPDGTAGGTPGGPPGGTPPIGPKPPEAPKKTDYPFAQKVPGKDGFVFSPYNQKVVDVRDIPPGTLVSDPTYPESEKKHFRVP